MKHIISAAFLVMVLALSVTDTYACACSMPEVARSFNEAHAVFIGEVSKIAEPRSNNPQAPLSDRLYAVTFKVEKSWKGISSFLREVTILSNQARFVCAWGSFVKGEKYLVYAVETQEKDLAVLFSCNRTATLADAAEDLKALERRGNSRLGVSFDFTYKGDRQKQ